MIPQLKPAIVVLTIFLAGGVAGYALHSLHPHHPPRPPHGMPHYLRELRLTDEQEEQAEGIFERHRADVEVLMRDTFPKVRDRNELMERELRALLTPEQTSKLDEIRAHRPMPPFGRGRDPGPGMGPPGMGPPGMGPPGPPPPPGP